MTNINIAYDWIETFIRESKQRELEVLRKIDEQKTIMKKIANEEDCIVDNFCMALRRHSSSWGDFIASLDKVNRALLAGMPLRKIIYNYLENKKYLNYGGEKNMADHYVRAFNTEMPPITKILAYREKDIRIVDVNPIVPNKVVEVTFAYGTKEKSVCREPDVFSMESAISICISKKIMGGSSAYNNAVKRGIKVYEDKQKRESIEKAERECIERKRAKRLAYKERRAAKKVEEEMQRRAREREEQIAIQTEAYLRAMRVIEDSKNNNIDEENN